MSDVQVSEQEVEQKLTAAAQKAGLVDPGNFIGQITGTAAEEFNEFLAGT